MPHPHGEACRCPAPGPDGGLLAYTVDCDHYEQLDRALRQLAAQPPSVTLRVLTTDPHPANLIPLPTVEPCDGTYTCRCPTHTAERAERVRRGPQRTPRQPWEARRAA